MTTAADIAAVAGKSKRIGPDQFLICCPAHDDRTPSCKVWDGETGPLFFCFGGCDWKEVRAAAEGNGWLPPFDAGHRETQTERLDRKRQLAERRKERRQQEAVEFDRKRAFAQGIWNGAGGTAGTPVEAYLQSRGINWHHGGASLSPSLRYGYVKEPNTGLHLPAMVSAVTVWPSDEVVGVHATYLTPQGTKAPVSTPKRMYGAIKGGAVQLSRRRDILAVAEGIESALSYAELFDVPTWATLSTASMKSVQIPDTLKRVDIAADNDGAGTNAARQLAHRLKREHPTLEVLIRKPREVGHDWNDALLQAQKETTS